MDWNPSRAKRRISSSPSQGFFERFKRSTLCAFVSFLASLVAAFPVLVIIFCPEFSVLESSDHVPENKKPITRLIWRWAIRAGIKRNTLDRQPPRARAHECTTTTDAHAHRGKILLHTVEMIDRVATRGQQT